MIRNPHKVAEFERIYAARKLAKTSYREALAVFIALWREAIVLNADFPSRDWESDIEPDLAIARAVNGLPPA